ncbi:hypothetical protein BELL_0263g00070 [Botrytis elliptica]|uniref:Uncharacterized protein n=1 Tax=Botrytis elliptica TaxID=278938 RepID=A0A4Z1JMY8_9HELO|nr:hypothetical protein BELL_0263g00070 [Botrytis elliptica]
MCFYYTAPELSITCSVMLTVRYDMILASHCRAQSNLATFKPPWPRIISIAPGIVEDRPKQTRRNGISTGKKVKLDLVTAAEWASSSPVVGTSNGGCDVITPLLQDEFPVSEFAENIRCEIKRRVEDKVLV